MSFTTQQLINFVNKKGTKFFNKKYPVVIDDMGLPSLIKLTATDKVFGLTQSIDRHYLNKTITKDLIDIMSFSEEESSQISEFYINEKYKEYKESLLSL